VTRPGAGGSGGDCFDALAAALLEPVALPALEDLESLSAVRDLAAELREHPDAVALRVRVSTGHVAPESMGLDSGASPDAGYSTVRSA
jgi:hypothetical protein